MKSVSRHDHDRITRELDVTGHNVARPWVAPVDQTSVPADIDQFELGEVVDIAEGFEGESVDDFNIGATEDFELHNDMVDGSTLNISRRCERAIGEDAEFRRCVSASQGDGAI